MRINTKLRESLINTTLVIVSILVGLLLIESYFAVFNPQLPVQTANKENEFKFFEYDSLLGWKNKPNAEGIFVMPDSTTLVKINSKGLRDKEYDYNKPEGIKRIIVLGDSFTWGYGVEAKDRFTEILNNKLPDNYEVINMGVSGYGTDQELLTLEREGLKYNPDLVVVGFHPGTDLDDNTNAIRYSYPKPLFVLSENNTLSLTNIPVPNKDDWTRRLEEDKGSWFAALKTFLSEHFHTYVFFSRVIDSNPTLSKLFQSIGLMEKQPFYKQYSWDLTESLLGEINTVSKNNGARTIIFIIRYQYTDIRLNDAMDKIATNLFDFGKRNDIAVVDYLPTFIKYAGTGEQLYFKHDGHLTASGNKLAAEFIYDNLVEDGLISR